MTRHLHAATFLSLLLLAGCARAFGPSAPAVDLVPASDDAPAHLQLTGLSSNELRDLRSVTWEAADWQRLWRESVEATPDLPVAGRYVVTERTLEFQPAFPLDAGRAYRVLLDLSRLPTPRTDAPISRTVALPAVDPGPPVEVTGIFPSGDLWPENLLRFYIHFSGPMARQVGIDHVRLVDDESGEEVVDALLESPVDFWSPDQRRYTVFFDPGRVKTDLVPNHELGRALRAGRRYTIVVDGAWEDAVGRPLRASHRRTFEAGPAVDEPLVLADWRLSAPAARSRDPLALTLPRPLDRAMIERAIGVARDGELVEGHVEVNAHETTWRFVPAGAWSSAPHELVVLAELEDPQGNRIDQAFEVHPSDTLGGEPRPERYTIPFTPR
jgi:hypothetical protein